MAFHSKLNWCGTKCSMHDTKSGKYDRMYTVYNDDDDSKITPNDNDNNKETKSTLGKRLNDTFKHSHSHFAIHQWFIHRHFYFHLMF